MTATKMSLCFCIAVVVSGCVAPETPPPVRSSTSAVPKSATSSASFEDAPLPNRKLGGPTGDSVIRLAR